VVIHAFGLIHLTPHESNRALQACTTEPHFSVERELHPTLTPQEYKPMIPTSSAPGSKPALTNSELAEPRGFSFLRHCSLTLTAVLVDAAFFLKRAARIYGHQTPEVDAKQLHRIALDHLNDDHGHRVTRPYSAGRSLFSFRRIVHMSNLPRTPAIHPHVGLERMLISRLAVRVPRAHFNLIARDRHVPRGDDADHHV
jgi:hypothetical protein